MGCYYSLSTSKVLCDQRIPAVVAGSLWNVLPHCFLNLGNEDTIYSNWEAEQIHGPPFTKEMKGAA